MNRPRFLVFYLELLIGKTRRSEIEPEVVRSYYIAFQKELRKLIQRSQNPSVCSKLEQMLDCLIRGVQRAVPKLQ